MTISLKNIIPQFLEKEKTEKSEIWGQDLVFRKGEKSQVVAPSGSGKTSLVHFMYGLRNDYNGDILFDGRNRRTLNATALADLRANSISIIFQDLRLFRDLTVLQNIEVKRALNPFHPAARIPEMAERLGIANKLSQQAGTCSYGEQQRIAIIRALQQPFDFIIMDEPFSHLDETNSRKAMELIEEEAAARNAAVILADLEPISFFKASNIYHL
ncbi:MAG: ATP-binding cassette domain-containing protein [Ferruginibacter sp.]